MTIENCTNSKIISEISRFTDQPDLQFKPYDLYDPYIGHDAFELFCRKAATI